MNRLTPALRVLVAAVILGGQALLATSPIVRPNLAPYGPRIGSEDESHLVCRASGGNALGRPQPDDSV